MIDACDRIIGLEAYVVVPGHGPLTYAEGVTAVRDYLSFIEKECKERHAAGQKATEAIAEIDLGPYKEWGEWERLAVNVHAIYREIEGQSEIQSPLDLSASMAELKSGV